MSKLTKQPKKNNTETSGACSSTCLASITSLLEEHRANIATDFKNTFAAMESGLEKIHPTLQEHNQRIVSLEDSNQWNDQHIRALELRCAALADSTDKLLAKMYDLESRSCRNNI